MKSVNAVFILQSLSGGGAERNMLILANHLLTENIKFQFVVFNKINDYKKEYKQTLSKIPIVVVSKDMFLNYIVRLFSLFFKNKNTVYVGAMEFLPYYTAILFSVLFNKKSILIVGNNITELLLRKKLIPRIIHTLCLSISFYFAHTIVCTSYGVRTDLQSHFRVRTEKLKVIYNGIDFSHSPRVLKTNSNTNVIVACGRLTEQKGFSHLISAFKYINAHIPQLELHILGKGELKVTLEAQIRALHLSGKVKLIGYIEKPNAYFNKGCIFVSSSLYEGFGNVIVEAMQSGLPVVSTHYRFGSEEILNGTSRYVDKMRILYGKWGVLTPQFLSSDSREMIEDKEKLLAEAILSLIKNKRLYKKYATSSKQRGDMFAANIMTTKITSLL